MIPQLVVATARHAVEVAIDERRAIFNREVADLRAQFSIRGMGVSTPMLQAVKDRISAEFKIRAMMAWQIWARALATQHAIILADLRGRLTEEIETALRLDALSSDLQQQYLTVRNVVNWMGDPADLLPRMQQQAMDAVLVEIDFAILEATKAQPAGAQTGDFHFYGPVGAVQTGPGASALVQQQFGAAERETIGRALEAVEHALPAAKELGAQDRQQLMELVVEARQDLEKPQPNPHRIRGTLTTIATSIQTLGAAAPAYALVKGALALMGVHIP